jgi:multidrug resistance efflux pump
MRRLRVQVRELEEQLAAARAQIGTQSGVISGYQAEARALRERLAKAEAPPY